MLKQRLITAFMLIPLVVWGVLALPTVYLAALLGLIVLLGAHEWSHFFPWPTARRRFYVGAMAVALLIAYNTLTNTVLQLLIYTTALLWWLVALRWVYQARTTGVPGVPREWLINSTGNNYAGGAFGFVVLLPCFVALISLHQNPDFGPGYTLFCMALMWVADSGAYFAGRKWGKTKLAPGVSPGKTWQGVWGALAVGAIWSLLGALLLEMSAGQTLGFIMFCGVVVAFSILGDLFESLFKRLAQVKDSGQLLPGHGGVLDRIDSLTAAAPLFALGLLLFF